MDVNAPGHQERGAPARQSHDVCRPQGRGEATKRDGGVGLGLTICRAIVAAHGGRIEARNRAGGGTTIQFILPGESNETARTSGLPEPPSSKEWSQPKNV